MAELHLDKLSVNQIKAAGDPDFLTPEQTAQKFVPGNAITGQSLYDTAGSYTFVVPAGVRHISVLCIGAGGGGHTSWANNGGGGGGVAWADNIAVEEGQSISVTVPGTTPRQQDGGNASCGGFLTATGGKGTGGAPRDGGSYVAGTVSPSGGTGGKSYYSSAGGGGGAGGYSGTGGNGYYGSQGNTPYNGTGGAATGGSGYDSSTYGFSGGGGVWHTGEGASGTWGQLTNQGNQPQNNGNSFYSDYRYSGVAGSDGEHAGFHNNSSSTSNKGRTIYHGEGGQYGGGGGGGGTSVSNNANFCRGGMGVVKIMYSTDSNFSIKNQ